MGANKELSPDDQVKGVSAALAEAGYPDAVVKWGDHHDERGVTVAGLTGLGTPPDSAVWRAFFLVYGQEAVPCWPCWSSGQGPDCDHEVRMSDCPIDVLDTQSSGKVK